MTDELEKLAVERSELVALHSGCDDALAALRAELAQVDSGELMSDSFALSPACDSPLSVICGSLFAFFSHTLRL